MNLTLIFEEGRVNNHDPSNDDKIGALVDQDDFILAEVCGDADEWDSKIERVVYAVNDYAALQASHEELVTALKDSAKVAQALYGALRQSGGDDMPTVEAVAEQAKEALANTAKLAPTK